MPPSAHVVWTLDAPWLGRPARQHFDDDSDCRNQIGQQCNDQRPTGQAPPPVIAPFGGAPAFRDPGAEAPGRGRVDRLNAGPAFTLADSVTVRAEVLLPRARFLFRAAPLCPLPCTVRKAALQAASGGLEGVRVLVQVLVLLMLLLLL